VSNSAAERPVATLDIIGFSPHATAPPSKFCDDTLSRPALGSNLIQVVPVPKTGLRGDYDFVKRVSKAGHGNCMVRRQIASSIVVVGGLVCANVSGLFVETSSWP
jgi:hypothetical protein